VLSPRWRPIAWHVKILPVVKIYELARHLGVDDDVDLPHDQSVCIPKAGHMPHFETPIELAAEIETFLRQYL
jgi:pimeloyl-ACP methyl ester carboxylesterase